MGNAISGMGTGGADAAAYDAGDTPLRGMNGEASEGGNLGVFPKGEAGDDRVRSISGGGPPSFGIPNQNTGDLPPGEIPNEVVAEYEGLDGEKIQLFRDKSVFISDENGVKSFTGDGYVAETTHREGSTDVNESWTTWRGPDGRSGGGPGLGGMPPGVERQADSRALRDGSPEPAEDGGPRGMLESVSADDIELMLSHGTPKDPDGKLADVETTDLGGGVTAWTNADGDSGFNYADGSSMRTDADGDAFYFDADGTVMWKTEDPRSGQLTGTTRGDATEYTNDRGFGNTETTGEGPVAELADPDFRVGAQELEAKEAARGSDVGPDMISGELLPDGSPTWRTEDGSITGETSANGRYTSWKEVDENGGFSAAGGGPTELSPYPELADRAVRTAVQSADDGVAMRDERSSIGDGDTSDTDFVTGDSMFTAARDGFSASASSSTATDESGEDGPVVVPPPIQFDAATAYDG